ncbi:protein UNUSUAL FLORAL ORGANS-like [Typha angustifolia]|uniref:protein UNUSUAL FLORAL ORGANS-like n=1 Tax=Typha angustifolia TaxID=59011 RepID=UPI003C2C5503
MWEELPLDVLSRLFSFLPPDSFARAMCTCRHWRLCALSPAPPPPPPTPPRSPPWFLAMAARSNLGPSFCYAHDPDLARWHSLPLDFAIEPLRLVAPLSGGLLLCKFAASTTLRLALCNPFTRQFRPLPDLLAPRSNPAVGVVLPATASSSLISFCVVVAGGASGASYQPTMEVYDSRQSGAWREAGSMPVEFAVRLTVWTPNESVHAADGVIYWMTSARAYSVVGFHVERREWREVKVPMADSLEWAALVRRSNGRLSLVGGAADRRARVWELREEDEWAVVGLVPREMERRFWGSTCSKDEMSSYKWGNTKCAGSEEGVYLFRELGSEMLVWRGRGEGKEWEWSLVKGNCTMPSIPIKALLLHPTLYPPPLN